ncbi:MAG: hypothetical protein OEY93_11050 [Anaerolineae bacterium]|nr:hypothetical protein [Anaerolineae bacterium]
MSAVKKIANIFSWIAIIFGFLFILGAFDPENGQTGWLLTGSILIIIGFGIIWFTSRLKTGAPNEIVQNTTLNIELPADVDIERFECQNCGSQLSMNNVKMVAGAPMVDCPYCDAAYQLTEKPKW